MQPTKAGAQPKQPQGSSQHSCRNILNRFKLDVDDESFVEEDFAHLNDQQIHCTDLLDHTDAESNESFHPDDQPKQATQSTGARPSTLSDVRTGRSPAKPSAAPGVAALDILAQIQELRALAPRVAPRRAMAKHHTLEEKVGSSLGQFSGSFRG